MLGQTKKTYLITSLFRYESEFGYDFIWFQKKKLQLTLKLKNNEMLAIKSGPLHCSLHKYPILTYPSWFTFPVSLCVTEIIYWQHLSVLNHAWLWTNKFRILYLAGQIIAYHIPAPTKMDELCRVFTKVWGNKSSVCIFSLTEMLSVV